MKIEGYLFAFLAAFLWIASVVYWYLSKDWTGTTCLVLAGALGGMIGYFLSFTARRMEARPEDRGDADISDGAGEVGFFSPHSWWPIAVAGAFSTLGIGLIFGFFIALAGIVLLGITITGLLFEYYVDRPFTH